jgi:hypothetical protein
MYSASDTKAVIPPQTEWVNFSVNQLYDTKAMLTERYYKMQDIRASEGMLKQIDMYINRIDFLISKREIEERENKLKEED